MIWGQTNMIPNTPSLDEQGRVPWEGSVALL